MYLVMTLVARISRTCRQGSRGLSLRLHTLCCGFVTATPAYCYMCVLGQASKYVELESVTARGIRDAFWTAICKNIRRSVWLRACLLLLACRLLLVGISTKSHMFRHGLDSVLRAWLTLAELDSGENM